MEMDQYFEVSCVYFIEFCAWDFTVTVTEAGIKCWVCNSFNDLGCGDPFDNSSFPITDCDAELNKRENLKGVPATMCRKLVQKSTSKCLPHNILCICFLLVNNFKMFSS